MSDYRDPRPCSTCGHPLVYDGWGMIHTSGPQRNYGEMNCAHVASRHAKAVASSRLPALRRAFAFGRKK